MLKYLYLGSFFFIIGFIGLTFVRRHIIIVIIFNELIFLAANLNFIIFSLYLDDISGQIYCFFLLTIAAAEAAIGLALLIVYYRYFGGISVSMISLLKG